MRERTPQDCSVQYTFIRHIINELPPATQKPPILNTLNRAADRTVCR
jgi:hypothetical protein